MAPLLVVLSLFGPTGDPNRFVAPSDSTDLVALEAVWNEAHVRGDAEALDRLWAEELVVSVPGMTPMSKADVMGVTRMGRIPFLRYETSDVQARVFGDAAVVTGRLTRVRVMNGADVTDEWKFTKTYVRRDGRWQVVAYHASA